jgi:hypothetical protein
MNNPQKLATFVLCTLCCQFLWIVHFWFPSWYSLTCLWYNINEINTQIMSINDIHVQKCISDFCLLQYKQRKVASYISSCFIMVGFVLLIVLVFWVVLSLSFCFVCLRSRYTRRRKTKTQRNMRWTPLCTKINPQIMWIWHVLSCIHCDRTNSAPVGCL